MLDESQNEPELTDEEGLRLKAEPSELCTAANKGD